MAQWGHLFTSTEEFTGEPSVDHRGETIVYVGQENRQHTLGHLGLLGLKRPVMPWSSDGPDEAELGGNLETTLSRWADACHEQGGTVVLPHFPYPYCEGPALIVDRTVGRGRVAPAGSPRPSGVLPVPEPRVPAAARRRARTR